MNDQVKIVHLGLGAFFKAHSAWYTYHCSDWKIVAFTGRSVKAAEELASNNFKYKLITKSADGDTEEIIDNVVEAYDGNNIGVLTQYISSPNVSIVTLTITEAGYTAATDSTLSKLLIALEKRFERNGKPIAIIPCDNLIQNGAKVRSIFNQLSESKSEALREGEFEIESVRNHNGILLLKFVGVDNRNAIEELRNSLLYCEVDIDAESDNPDEYHLQQLIGCKVVLEDGSDFGKVIEVMDMPAQAVLVIKASEKEVMVPFVKVWVPSVDIESKKIVIRKP